MPLTPKDRGYIAGVCDARKARNLYHRKTTFDRHSFNQLSIDDRRAYLAGYWEGMEKQGRIEAQPAVPGACAHENIDLYFELCDHCGAPVKLPEPKL